MKWVACWGNATSITERKESTYSKDITLRYPVYMCFDGDRIRLHFSNLTGTEPVVLSYVSIMRESGEDIARLTYNGVETMTIAPGCEIVTDELPYAVRQSETLLISIYLGEFTQMNAGTLITGPLSRGQYGYGDLGMMPKMPIDVSRQTNWFYFLNTIDVYTTDDKFAVICYGDSITAQSWPDYLLLRAKEEGFNNVSIIRRAVCGTRILREYDCITYQSYGLKGATRFPIEMNVSGARSVIIQHGINDIIHPVGVDVNPFRPWSDFPTVEQLQQGIRDIYVNHARKCGYNVYSGTLLPIYGWRTYCEKREQVRGELNSWLRTAECFDACIDFDAAVADPANPICFAPGFDSGDHLHPSEQAYKAMAMAVPEWILK